MTDRIVKLSAQISKNLFVIRNLACHKTLYKYKDDFKKSYWKLIFNNFLDIAIIEWCKMFDSKDDTTHWSNHIKNKKEVGDKLLKWANMSQQEWDKYREDIKCYGNSVDKYHKQNIKSYPDFSCVVIACYVYYDALIKELRMLGVNDYPDELKEFYQSCLGEATEFTNAAYSATLEIDKKAPSE